MASENILERFGEMRPQTRLTGTVEPMVVGGNTIVFWPGSRGVFTAAIGKIGCVLLLCLPVVSMSLSLFRISKVAAQLLLLPILAVLLMWLWDLLCRPAAAWFERSKLFELDGSERRMVVYGLLTPSFEAPLCEIDRFVYCDGDVSVYLKDGQSTALTKGRLKSLDRELGFLKLLSYVCNKPLYARKYNSGDTGYDADEAGLLASIKYGEMKDGRSLAEVMRLVYDPASPASGGQEA